MSRRVHVVLVHPVVQASDSDVEANPRNRRRPPESQRVTFVPTFATMKIAVVASLIASAAAFAPASKPASSTAIKSYENELGVIVSSERIYWPCRMCVGRPVPNLISFISFLHSNLRDSGTPLA
jgi:hypothetical protein